MKFQRDVMKMVPKAWLLASVLVLSPLVCFAQDSYPNRPIRIVVPQAAASGGDVLARLMAEKIGPKLGQPIVIENRPGANGVIAAEMIKNDTSAGYTLLLTGVSVLSFNQSLYKDLPYKPFSDFAYIAPVADTSFVLLASKASGINSVKDFVEKSKGEKTLHYGSAGVGNSGHLAMEMIADRTGVMLTHVPYKGSTPIYTALLTGEVDFTMGIPNAAVSYIKDGRVSGLAAMSEQRLPELPNVPTFKELGIDMPVMPGWYALVGPANMKLENVTKLNKLVQDFLNDPEVRAKLVSMSLTPSPGSPEQIRTRAMRDAKVWGDLIAKNKIEIQ
jgi:tripartite-type tricarboxylate transporter receptor subunit TctC